MSRRVLALSLAVAALYLVFLGRHGLHESDEGRYAEIAREMKDSGDLLIPTLNGVPHFQKPPVIYWSTAASLAVLGENELAARMVSLLAALGVLVLTYWIGRWWFDRTTGIASVWILAGSWQFFMLGRSLTPDMMMTLLVDGRHCRVRLGQPIGGDREGALPALLRLHGCGLRHQRADGNPGTAVHGYRLAVGESSSRASRGRSTAWVAGLTLTLALALGWFIAASLRHPELGRYFFEFELLDRFLSKTHGRSQPIWYFIPVLLVGWLPWTPLFPMGLLR